MNEVDAPANAVAAVTHPDPYPFYADLVRERPLYYDEELASWVVSSADAVSAVLGSDGFRVRPLDEPIPSALAHSAAGDLFGRFIRMTDNADRGRLKSIIADHVDALDIKRVGEVTEACATFLFACLGRPPDWRLFTPEFALRLSPYVLAKLLVVHECRVTEICEWLDAFVRCLSLSATAEDVERGAVAAEHLLSTMDTERGFVADVKGDVRQSGFADPTVAVANAVGLLFQSYEATAGLIGNTLIELSRRAVGVDKEHSEPTTIYGVVEHVVRNDSPVQNTRRYAAKRITMLGETFAKGDRLLLVLAAANRDPNAGGRIFTFGAGVHACPGAALATTIATKALECIVGQRVDVAHVADEISYRPSKNARIPVFGQRA